ncbi:MAG: metal-dependent hydrolase [Bacteroidia bacterium]|nr:metal-dependent hydrolase [Bacteroidia bacterium]
MEIKYYGHSCFSVKAGGKTLLFDPFIKGNPLAAGIDIKDIHADYILISHGHHDHTDDALEIAKNCNSTIISVFEIAEWAKKNGCDKTVSMNTGGSREFDFGMVKLVNAVHSSSFKDGTYAGNPVGFVINDGEKTFYFAGDTSLCHDMKMIPERYKLDFAFLPIGSNFTMDVEDAVKAAEYLQCNTIIGMHYDTEEKIKIDHDEARRNFNSRGRLLMLFKIGESFEL